MMQEFSPVSHVTLAYSNGSNNQSTRIMSQASADTVAGRRVLDSEEVQEARLQLQVVKTETRRALKKLVYVSHLGHHENP